jgi:hypothetical protein
MEMSYKPVNPFMDTFVDQKRQINLAKLAETNPAIKQQLVENSEKDLIPNAIKWIKSRPVLKKKYDKFDKYGDVQGKKQMITDLIKTWEIHNNTTPQTNGSWFGGKRKTKKQRKHRKAGKSKKQRKTKPKTKKHRKAGKSKKQRKT